jgi:phage anti-repressor protein
MRELLAGWLYSAKSVWKKQGLAETKKTLFLTIITTYGVKKNDYYISLVQNNLRIEALFKRPVNGG